ncbi:MAG: GntR family transcriptional regulator [Deltaproteobacteria bacterium]|nr:GntR family transcriptional regulator [Deltaproteobacteria bacterium]
MARYMTMTEMALESLRRSILRGKLKPGTPLVPAKLDKELSLSREAIRDAIRQIVGYGLAETIPNKGTYVAQPLTLGELEMIFQLRMHAEPEIAVSALKHLTADQVTELEHLASQMETLSESTENFADHFILNREFHLNLYKPAEWSHLHRFIALWIDQILIFRSCLYPKNIYKDISKFNQEHRNILKAIQDKDPAQLKALVKSNLQSGLENIRRNYADPLRQQIDSNRRKVS